VFSGATEECDMALHRNIILNRNCYHLASLEFGREIVMNIKHERIWIFFHFGKIATNKI
jgi:hypothetical protein